MKRHHRTFLVLILLTTAAAYAGVVGAGFVWDDQWLLVTNSHFQKASLGDLLRGNLWAGTGFEGGVRYFRPLLQLTFYIDREVFGMVPAGWHLHSLAWHLVSTALLYHLLRRLLTESPVAPTSAAPGEQPVLSFWKDPTLLPVVAGTTLFALHPIQSEAVAWIAARNDLLATAFVLASLHCLLPGRRASGAGRVVAGTLFYLCALWAKESAALLPLLVLLLEWARGLRCSRRTVARYLAMLAGFAVAISVRAWVGAGGPGDVLDAPGASPIDVAVQRLGPILERLPTVLGTYGLMVVKPWPMIATRYLDFMPPGLPPSRIAGLLVWVALPLLTLLQADPYRRRLAWAALGCAWLTFAPSWLAIGTFKFMGERYLYLPIAFLAMWLAMIIPARRPSWAVLSTAAVASLLALHLRVPDWRDDLSLFSADAQHAPNCWNLTFWARALTRHGHPERALQVLKPIVPAVPDCTPGWTAAMEAAMAAGDLDRVLALGNAVEAFGPAFAHAPAPKDYYALALALKGRWNEAEQIAEPLMDAYPMSRAAMVLAAQRWRTGNVEAYEDQARRWTDRRRMETWVARLLARTGEQEALDRLRARGVDPTAKVPPLDVAGE